MSTTLSRKRVNLSLDPDLLEALEGFAKRENITPTSKAMEYVARGIEEDEDRYWSAVADKAHEAFVADGCKTISFEDVWKENFGSPLPKKPDHSSEV